MADLEARREARRRKILENSDNRLKKISGVEEKSTKSELDGIRLNNTYESIRGSAELLQSHDESPTLELQNNVSSNSIEVETIFRNPRDIANDSASNCYVEDLEHKNYRTIFIFVMPIILSFLLVTFDFFQFDVKFYYLNKIFLPFIAYEIIQYFIVVSPNNPSNLLNSLLLLVNIRNPIVLNIVEHFQSFMNILQDVMVYFFVFSVSYWLLHIIV